MKLRMGMMMLCALLTGAALMFAVHGEPPASGGDELLRAVQAQQEELKAIRAELRALRDAHPAVASAAGQDGAGLRAELIRAVQEAMASARPGEASAASQPAPEAAAPSAQSLAVREEVQRLIQRATVARRWTDQDAAELRELADDVSGTERLELHRRLAVAINSGQLVVETRGPPF